MDNVSDLRVSELTSSRYLKPYRLHFKRDGQQLSWDYIVSHDSLAVLLLNKSQDTFILVKQFRPAVLMHLVHQHISNDRSETEKVTSGLNDQCTGTASSDSPPAVQLCFPVSPIDPGRACCYELCAGLVDKSGKSLAAIAREEILEECGYDVPLEGVRRITSYQSNVGLAGSRQTLFYAEVTDDMKVGKGGGLESEGEMIDVINVLRSEMQTFIMDETKPKSSSLLFAISLFFSSPELFHRT